MKELAGRSSNVADTTEGFVFMKELEFEGSVMIKISLITV